MKVWITRYALTEGVFEEEVELLEQFPNIGVVKERGGYYQPPDWHRTREEAVKRAEEMRVKKIASLKRQIDKLSKMRFEKENSR